LYHKWASSANTPSKAQHRGVPSHAHAYRVGPFHPHMQRALDTQGSLPQYLQGALPPQPEIVRLPFSLPRSPGMSMGSLIFARAIAFDILGYDIARSPRLGGGLFSRILLSRPASRLPPSATRAHSPSPLPTLMTCIVFSPCGRSQGRICLL
jgi:hypothetical protein